MLGAWAHVQICEGVGSETPPRYSTEDFPAEFYRWPSVKECHHAHLRN